MSVFSCAHCRKHYYPMPQHCREQGSAKTGGERVTYLQDCCQSLILRLCSDSYAASSEVLTSITRPRFTISEPCLDNSLFLGMCTRRTSSLAFDLLSRATRLCCRNAATSTSGGGTLGGELALRLPLWSMGRTIFEHREHHRKVVENTTTQTQRRGWEGAYYERPAWPKAATSPMGTDAQTYGRDCNLWPGTHSRHSPRVRPPQRRPFSRSSHPQWERENFKSTENLTFYMP